MTESHRVFFLLLACLQGIGCATGSPQPTPIPDDTLVAQQEMFDSIFEGQALDDTLTLIANFTTSIVEALDDDVVHHYVEAHYPETKVRLGVYFENRRLVALILERDVNNLRLCRMAGQSALWSDDGITPYTDWIKTRNMLGKSFDKRAHHNAAISSGSYSAAEAVEAATYAPIIAVALGAYTIDRLMGGIQRDSRRKRERNYLERTAPTVQLGATEDVLLSLMGSSDRRIRVNTMTVISYSQPSYSYVFENDKLVWKETPSMLETQFPVGGFCLY